MTFPRNIFPTLLIVFVACNAYADQYSGLQLSTRDISTLAALKVTPEYVQEMRSYFPNISAREITNLYALKVKPKYLKEMRSYFPNMDVRDVTNLYALKVTPEYLKEMRSYFPNIGVRDVTNLYALKVPPEYVKEIRDLGYSDISIREIVEFYALKVQPGYIKQMRESGQPIVPGQHIHIPEIHIPEIHIPEIEVQISPVSAVSPIPVIPTSQPSLFKTIAEFSGGISIVLALILFVGFVVSVLRKRFGDSAQSEDESLNSRIANFEHRVNDLQDILLSIDDRLDRRIHQN